MLRRSLAPLSASCPFRTLGLPRTASVAEIKAAWRRRALQTHPDVSTSSSETEFVAAKLAYERALEIANRPVQRVSYDEAMRMADTDPTFTGRERGFGPSAHTSYVSASKALTFVFLVAGAMSAVILGSLWTFSKQNAAIVTHARRRNGEAPP
jgi:DnaJ-class molecular chaperone